jgi:predicted transcriptional regulator
LGAILNEKDAINVMLIILETAKDASSSDIDNIKKAAAVTTMTTSILLYNVLFDLPRLKEYWNALIQEGLLNFDSNTGRFKTTEEGRTFLKAYKAIDYDVIKAKTRTSSSSPRLEQREVQ